MLKGFIFRVQSPFDLIYLPLEDVGSLKGDDVVLGDVQVVVEDNVFGDWRCRVPTDPRR